MRLRRLSLARTISEDDKSTGGGDGQCSERKGLDGSLWPFALASRDRKGGVASDPNTRKRTVY